LRALISSLLATPILAFAVEASRAEPLVVRASQNAADADEVLFGVPYTILPSTKEFLQAQLARKARTRHAPATIEGVSFRSSLYQGSETRRMLTTVTTLRLGADVLMVVSSYELPVGARVESMVDDVSYLERALIKTADEIVERLSLRQSTASPGDA
jgi:hypothetical protein